MTWENLLQRAGERDKVVIKRELPLAFVVMAAGVQLEQQYDGRLVGRCPFHEDDTPSFAVFGDQLERCGCWSCDFGNGDVYDFIMRWKGVGFGAAVVEAAALLEAYKASGWDPPRMPERREVDPLTLEGHVTAAYNRALADRSAVANVVMRKRLKMPPEWLVQEFRLGVLDDVTTVIPHVGWRDERWRVTGYKTRVGERHPLAAPGSHFDELYGAWRDNGAPWVILCEGESDTWTVAWEFRDRDVAVLGLPAGAGQLIRPAWLHRLRGRGVILLFDGDDAGRDALLRWWTALAQPVDDDNPAIAARVRVAGLEDGMDAAEDPNLVRTVEEALEVPDDAGLVTERDDGRAYVRAANNVPLTDWTLRVERLLVGEGEYALEGALDDGTPVILSTSDLGSDAALTSWANRLGRSWLGTKRDAQGLLNLLMRRAPFLSRGRLTRVAGWHEGVFVLPDRRLGPRYWRYLPPVADVKLRERVTVGEGPWDARVITTLMALHRSDVMTPLLAWTAAAPVRALVRLFPVLSVTGGAGTGKTTLLSEILGTFGWNVAATLTATTPHAVHSLAGSSNGIPVWFDEYRPGGRGDTMLTLQQVARDAWEAGSSLKGGLVSGNFQALTSLPATAPLAVSGEDVFTEVSHLERSVIVDLPPEGRNEVALRALKNLPREGFGLAYLVWLVESHHAGTLPLPVTPRESDRPAWTRAVLEWGWHLWTRFAAEVAGLELPPPDWSALEREVARTRSEDVVVDMLRWGTTKRDRNDAGLVVWTDDEGNLLVRLRELLALARENATFQLPGGERAIRRYLQARFDGVVVRTEWGRTLRLRNGARILADEEVAE